ncbi:MAG TPA: VOC family protein [Verrucomicrobiae bacterium]|jgi:methylmalonyl-CoA/ethylmalonyl-CoA epimerase|nr:VOC family protein [Verrucomicrobiae bacterium]
MESSIAGLSSLQGMFHHIGIVVESIQNNIQGFLQSLHAEWDGTVFHDPNQGVRVSFLHSKRAGNPVVELVEPAGENSPVTPFLKRGGGLHHLCYEVEDLEHQLQLSRRQGAIVVRAPLPAVAFQQRRIAWVYTKNKLLVEYLERTKKSTEE